MSPSVMIGDEVSPRRLVLGSLCLQLVALVRWLELEFLLYHWMNNPLMNRSWLSGQLGGGAGLEEMGHWEHTLESVSPRHLLQRLSRLPCSFLHSVLPCRSVSVHTPSSSGAK